MYCIIIIEFCSNLEKIMIFVKYPKWWSNSIYTTVWKQLSKVLHYSHVYENVVNKMINKKWKLQRPQDYSTSLLFCFNNSVETQKINMRIVMFKVGIHVTSMPFVQSRVWKHGIQRLYWIIFCSYIEAINSILYKLKHIQNIVRECTSIELQL